MVPKKSEIIKIKTFASAFTFLEGFGGGCLVVVCGVIRESKGGSAVESKKCDSILKRVEALVVFDEVK